MFGLAACSAELHCQELPDEIADEMTISPSMLQWFIIWRFQLHLRDGNKHACVFDKAYDYAKLASIKYKDSA